MNWLISKLCSGETSATGIPSKSLASDLRSSLGEHSIDTLSSRPHMMLGASLDVGVARMVVVCIGASRYLLRSMLAKSSMLLTGIFEFMLMSSMVSWRIPVGVLPRCLWLRSLRPLSMESLEQRLRALSLSVEVLFNMAVRLPLRSS